MQRLIIVLLALAAVALCKEQVNNNTSEEGQEDGENRILGGVYPQYYDFITKYSAFVYTENNGACSGVVIHENYVLTSATCVRGAVAVYVQTGITNVLRSNRMEVYPIGEHDIFIHPYFDIETYEANLAILRTDSANYPIHLKTVNYTLERGEKHVVSGFGLVGDAQNARAWLRYKYVSIFSDGYCEKTHEGTYNRQTNLCTTGGSGACKGDEGAPLVDPNRSDYRYKELCLVGIASHGMENCKDRRAALVYTNVYPYTTWINNIINS